MVRSPRASARREILRQLKGVKARLETVKWWWSVDGRVWGEGDVRTAPPYRERRLDEYPETQVRYWAGTVQEIDNTIRDLQTLREFALAEWTKTTGD